MNVEIILTGTDPQSRRGGIGVAMAGYVAALEAAGLPFVSIPSYHPTRPGGKWRLWLAAFPKVYRTVQRIQAAGRVPVVYSHAGAGLSLVRECSLLAFARLAGARTMLQLHAVAIDRYLAGGLARWLLLAGFRAADLLCVLTPWWRERLEAGGVRHPLAVVPDPLPPTLEEVAARPRQAEPAREGGPVRLLTLTRLVAGKGVERVIEAMAALPREISLSVAGEGADRPRLEALARRLELGERVRFTGWVADEAKSALLATSDVFCLPSAFDSFGMGFVEAMAFGLPVVALRQGPTPDVVPHGRAGWLVEDGRPETLAAAIGRLLSPALRAEMGRAGKAWVLEQYAAAVVGERIKQAVADL